MGQMASHRNLHGIPRHTLTHTHTHTHTHVLGHYLLIDSLYILKRAGTICSDVHCKVQAVHKNESCLYVKLYFALYSSDSTKQIILASQQVMYIWSIWHFSHNISDFLEHQIDWDLTCQQIPIFLKSQNEPSPALLCTSVYSYRDM